MIKKLVMTAAAILLAVPAMAQEREATYFSGGVLVENPTYYAHGCNAFQYIDIAQSQADQLRSSGNCSVESSADGGIAQSIGIVQAELAAAAAAAAAADPVDPGDTAEVADPVQPAIARLQRVKRWLASRT